jgi:hypothetical protein
MSAGARLLGCLSDKPVAQLPDGKRTFAGARVLRFGAERQAHEDHAEHEHGEDDGGDD